MSLQKVEVTKIHTPGNFVAASFAEVLSWCDYACSEVKTETILSGVEKCYMSADPGDEFEVEAAPEAMEIEVSDKQKEEKKIRKKIVAVKSKSAEELKRWAAKKERARKKFERQKKKESNAEEEIAKKISQATGSEAKESSEKAKQAKAEEIENETNKWL